jgi:lipopolysaccharide transport system ATP-binding protein
MSIVISIENLSKSYRLGQIGTGTFTYDLLLWWARLRGKPNPLRRIGETDHGNRVGEEVWALKDVSFQVRQGEVLGIIGRNGAGKSTLLKILSRVTAPTSGEIKVKGRVASLLEVGTGFHPDLTGRENVFLNGAILGMSRREIEQKFDEIVDFAGVEKFIDTPVKRYSSGMYVRLAFAVAAHLDPEILVVDEVLAVGDAEFQKKCLGKMNEVAHQGRTVLFVSHNMGAIQSLCSRSILLSKGNIIQDGPSIDVIKHYLKNEEKETSTNLALRSDRRGYGNNKLVDMFISLDGVHKAGYLMTGQPAYFVIHVEPAGVDVNCRFTILDGNRLPIAHFNSAMQSAEDQVFADKKTVFVCAIKDLFLSPGNFVANVMVSNRAGIQDHVESALAFSVEYGQQEGRQISREGGHGIVSIPHRWVIKDK